MENPTGFRFHPTDEEMIDNYLRPKNLNSNTSNIDEVINTVDICSFDPWDLPYQSRIKSEDQIWYFFGCKESKGERQSRKTKSGFWKKTGVTMDIRRKSGDYEKIGEKRVLVFHFGKNQKGFGSKSGWVMHEYHATFSSPNQVMRYTFCKVKFKGQRREIYCPSRSEIQNIHSLIPHTNHYEGLGTKFEGSSSNTQESQNPSQYSGYIDEQDAQMQDALCRGFDNLSSDDWNYLLNVDEQSKNISMQENYSHYIPQKPLSGVFDDHSSDDDDDDSDLIFATTVNFKDIEIGEHNLDQKTNKKKKEGLFDKMIQKLMKKVHTCSSISGT